MTDLLALLDDHPTLLRWVAVAAVIVFVLKRMVEASETIRTLLGPLGRRWKSQAEREAEKNLIRSESAKTERTDSDARVVDMARQIAHLSQRVVDLEAASEVKDNYLVYDAEWHTTNEIEAARSGYQFPLPKHVNYIEFQRKAKEQ